MRSSRGVLEGDAAGAAGAAVAAGAAGAAGAVDSASSCGTMPITCISARRHTGKAASRSRSRRRSAALRWRASRTAMCQRSSARVYAWYCRLWARSSSRSDCSRTTSARCSGSRCNEPTSQRWSYCSQRLLRRGGAAELEAVSPHFRGAGGSSRATSHNARDASRGHAWRSLEVLMPPSNYYEGKKKRGGFGSGTIHISPASPCGSTSSRTAPSKRSASATAGCSPNATPKRGSSSRCSLSVDSIKGIRGGRGAMTSFAGSTSIVVTYVYEKWHGNR